MVSHYKIWSGFPTVSWWLQWKPLKTIKLNRNENGYINASGRRHLKLTCLLSPPHLPCASSLFPSQPFCASGTWLHPDGTTNRVGSTLTAPWTGLAALTQFLWKLARSWVSLQKPSPCLWADLPFWRPRPAEASFAGKAMKLLFLFVPDSVFSLGVGSEAWRSVHTTETDVSFSCSVLTSLAS